MTVLDPKRSAGISYGRLLWLLYVSCHVFCWQLWYQNSCYMVLSLRTKP